MSRLLIIDGNALMHRSYHAIPPFKTRAGFPTNALYGFLTILFKAISDLKPTNLIVCFDTPVPTFRKKIFKDYQSHRPALEDNLKTQFPAVKEALEAAGITHIEKEGFEADDVIGTLSHDFDKTGTEIFIMTGDRDIMQLVNDRTFVVTPAIGFSTTVIYSPGEVVKRFGITPRQIPDFKALMGDASDNYKGAKGIGPKTAAKLINQFGTVENIFKNIDKVEGKLQTLLKEHREHVILSKQLATILTNLELHYNEKSSGFSGFKEPLKDTLIKYEMRSLLARFFKEKKEETPKTIKLSKNSKDKNQLGLF